MKKIISMILCLAMLVSTVSFCFPAMALDIDFDVESYEDFATSDEPAAELEAVELTGVLPVSASGYEGKTEDVDPRYPGAYYTFEDAIDPETLTLENIGNADVKFFDYDSDTNTVILFRATVDNKFGATLSFGDWNSEVETVGGEKISFPALSYTLAKSFPETGENLIPYGDFEHGYAPSFNPQANIPTSVVNVGGNHMLYVNASDYEGGLATNIRTYAAFEADAAYEVVYDIKYAGMSKKRGGVTAAEESVKTETIVYCNGTMTGQIATSGSNFTLEQYELAPAGGWLNKKGIFTVTSKKTASTQEYFNFKANYTPYSGTQTAAERRTASYYIDNVAAYKRCDIFYEAGNYAKLKESAQEIGMTEGVFLDGISSDKAKISEAAMPYEVIDDRWFIDEDKPWIDQDGNEYAIGDTVTMTKSLTLTPNVKTNLNVYEVTFVGTGLESTPASVKMFEGDTIDLTEYYNVKPANSKYRFNGWTTVEGSADDVIESAFVDGPLTFYALVNYDFNFAFESAYTNITLKDATMEKMYNGNSIRLTPAGNKDTSFAISSLNIPTHLYSMVRVHLDLTDPETAFMLQSTEVEGLFFNTDLYYDANAGDDFSSKRHLCPSHQTVEKVFTDDELIITYHAYEDQYWEGNLTAIRFDAYNGDPAWAVRKIEFIESEVAEETEINFTGIDAPVAGARAPTAKTVTDMNGLGQVSYLGWSPDLLDGTKFDTGRVYTVEMTITPKVGTGKRFADGTTVSFDGEPMESTQNADGTISLTYTYPQTLDANKFTVTFSSEGLLGSLKLAPASTTAIEGMPFYTTDFFTGIAVNEANLRFNGWSTKKSAEFKDVEYVIDVNENITLYPVISYDFNFAVPANRSGWDYTASHSEEGDDPLYWYIRSDARDMNIKRSVSIPTFLFKSASAYFAPGYEAVNNDGIFFHSEYNGSDNENYKLRYKSTEPVDPDTGLVRVDYASENTNWKGTVNYIRYDIFNKEDYTAPIMALTFNYADILSDATLCVEDIMQPVAGVVDTTKNTAVETTGNGSFYSIEWQPALNDGRFAADTVYTAKVSLSPKPGYRFDETPGSVRIQYGNEIKDAAVNTSTGLATASFVLPGSGKHKQFGMIINGESTFYFNGVKKSYSVSFTGECPDKTIVWSVNKSTVASINEKTGVLTPFRGGSVVVTATSSYNPAVKATMAVSIKYYPFTATVSGPDTISKANRITQYKLALSNQTINDNSASWYVDDESVAVIDEHTGKLIPYKNGTVTVIASSNYNPTVMASKKVTITDQDELATITYHPGTTDTVMSLPDPQKARGMTKLCEEPPVRDGYLFIGWATSEETLSVVSSVNVTKDIDVYAVWGKGMIWDFDETTGNMGQFSGITNGSMKLEGDYLHVATPANAHDLRITTNALNFDPKKYRTIAFRMAISEEAGGNAVIFMRNDYINENGQSASIGYNESDQRYAETIAVRTPIRNKGLENFETYVVDAFNYNGSNTPGVWGYPTTYNIQRFWIDIFDGYGIDAYVDYFAILESTRAVTFEKNTEDEVIGMPDPQDVFQGDTFTVKEVPVRDGYDFIGWAKAPDSSDVKDSFFITDDLTLYAIWAKAFAPDGQESEYTVVNIGAVDPADGDAVFAMTDAPKGTYMTFSYIDCDGKPMQTSAKIYANGAIYFTIPEEDMPITEAKLYLESKYSFKNVNLMPSAIAETRVSNKEEGSGFEYKESTGGKVVPKNYDMSLNEVVSSGDAYDPSTLYPDTVSIKSADHVSPAEASKVPGDILFNFDSEDDIDLFANLRQFESNGIARSVVSLEAKGFAEGSNDSPALITSALNVDAAKHKYIVMKAKQTGFATPDIKIYFKRDGLNFSEANTRTEKVGSDYSMVVYNMGAVEGWVSSITQLMISACGDMKGTLDIDWILFTNTVPESMDAIEGYTERFPVVESGEFPFTDVKDTDWFRKDVEQAYRLGFIKGMTETLYDPTGEITISEAITMAVRLNYGYNDIKKEIENADGDEWYKNYVDAAISAGIIKEGQFENYNAPAKRRDIAMIMYKSVPSEYMTAINMFKFLPDIDKTDSAFSTIIKLYNAGVLVGSDEIYTFRPDSNISRAEIAAVINRIAIPENRKRIVTQEEFDYYSQCFTAVDFAAATKLDHCTTDKFTVSDGLATAKPKTSDPNVYLTDLVPDLNGANYSTVRVGMKWDMDSVANPTNKGCSIFFTTAEGSWSEDRRIMATWDGTVDENGIGEFIFDLKSNEAFATTITAIRFDPYDKAGAEFSLSYVNFEP